MNQSEILVDNPVVQKIFVTVAFSFTIILSTASVLGKLDYLSKLITYELWSTTILRYIKDLNLELTLKKLRVIWTSLSKLFKVKLFESFPAIFSW